MHILFCTYYFCSVKRILRILLCLPLLVSCAEGYNITGKSTVSALDGKTLSLQRLSEDGKAETLDTCRVVHGSFAFQPQGEADCFAFVYTNTGFRIPIVVESGSIRVQVDNMGQRVEGGELNKRLYKHLQSQRRLYWEWDELQGECMQLMREGKSLEDVQKKMGKKLQKVSDKIEKAETRFIIDNADNVLGSGYFVMLCQQKYQLPVVTEQVREIVKHASPAFLADPEVSFWLRAAQLNPASLPLYDK